MQTTRFHAVGLAVLCASLLSACGPKLPIITPGVPTATPSPTPHASATPTSTPTATPTATPTPTPAASPTPLAYHFTAGYFPLNLGPVAGSNWSVCLDCNATDYGTIATTQVWNVPTGASGEIDFYSGFTTDGTIAPALPPDNADATYAPVVYYMMNNLGSSAITLRLALLDVGNRAGWGATAQCALDAYTASANGYAWSHTGLSGPIVSGATAFPSGATVAFTFDPGESIYALACK